MPVSRQAPQTKSLTPIIMAWAVLLVVFWMMLLPVSQSTMMDASDFADTGVVINNLAPQVSHEATDDGFLNVDEAEEHVLLTITKQIFTFVSVSITLTNSNDQNLNVPVATIGIRG